MKINIDIMNGFLQPIGEGPITTAFGWRDTSKLDQAGTFSFTMPLSDPKSQTAVQQMRVRCWAQSPLGSIIEIGSGIINGRRVINGDTPLLVVSGTDLMGELVHRSVGFLQIAEDTVQSPSELQEVTSTNIDLPLARDGNAATYNTITLQGGEYLYGGGDSPTAFFDFVGHGGVFNTNAGVLTVQYFDGTGWVAVSGLVDNTSVSGKTFGQNGRVEWTLPTDWAQMSHDAKTKYWWRASVSLNTTAFRIAEITQHALGPKIGDVADIMAFAPSGWSLDTSLYYDSTINGTYAQFAGESVLAALIRTAKVTGEHFRLGEGRVIQWLQTDQPPSVVRAMRAGAGHLVDVLGNIDICLVNRLEFVEDSVGLITRIYPYGAGNGTARLTLAQTTETPPAGYTLDAVNNYIEADTPVLSYDIIEAYVPYKNIRNLTGDNAGEVAAANQLFTAALNELQRRCEPANFYRLSVTKVDHPITHPISPGEILHVSYRHYTEPLEDHSQLIIEADLLVLEVTRVIDANGIQICELLVTDADRWPSTDTDVLTDQIDKTETYESHPQPVDYNQLVNRPISVRSVGWDPLNITSLKTFDPATVTLAQLGHVTGTIILSLKDTGTFE